MSDGIVLPSVYLETSFISYLGPRLSTNIMVAARQVLTRKWWSQKRHQYRLFISPLVIAETGHGDENLAHFRKQRLAQSETIPASPAVNALAKYFLVRKVVPARASADAMHISFAATAGVDYLLTWNCKHIANAAIQKLLRDLCREKGRELPIICTPEELMGGKK